MPPGPQCLRCAITNEKVSPNALTSPATLLGISDKEVLYPEFHNLSELLLILITVCRCTPALEYEQRRPYPCGGLQYAACVL